jgi:cell division protein FtsB
MARQNIATAKKVMTRKRLLVIGVLTALILAFVLFSSHGLISRWELTSERSALRDEIQALKGQEDSLRHLIQQLEHDTIEIERLARERYGYHRPGEKVYIIKNEDRP